MFKFKGGSLFALLLILPMVLMLTSCATTDHDRYDRYAKSISDMQTSIQKTNTAKVKARGEYMVSMANKPFMVIKFDETGTKLREVLMNNSIFLNQAAMQGGGEAYQQFAFAQTLQNMKGPNPYWYETLSSGLSRNLGGLFGIAGMTWMGISGMNAIADVAANANPGTITNINSGNTARDGSSLTSTAVSNSSDMSIGTGVGEGGSGLNSSAMMMGPETMTDTGTGTGTDTGVMVEE